jgi:uncharacterized UBP type Zn finger protein
MSSNGNESKEDHAFNSIPECSSGQAVNDNTATTVLESSVASAAVATDNDETIASVFQAIDTLENIYGFPLHIAQQAIEVVGPDVSAAYNYILDQGLAQDQGGPVVPISNCPHVLHHVKLTPEQLVSPHDAPCSHVLGRSSRSGGAKGDVDVDGSCPSQENWICLQCGVIRCSRYVNGHGIAHYEVTVTSDPGDDHAGHCVGVSLADLSVWCYACQAYLEDPTVQRLVMRLQELKFEHEK